MPMLRSLNLTKNYLKLASLSGRIDRAAHLLQFKQLP